jgi:hypothetical protein
MKEIYPKSVQCVDANRIYIALNCSDSSGCPIANGGSTSVRITGWQNPLPSSAPTSVYVTAGLDNIDSVVAIGPNYVPPPPPPPPLPPPPPPPPPPAPATSSAASPSTLSLATVVALAVIVSTWSLNLLAVAWFAHKNHWSHPWKMLLVASVLVGPLAILLWWPVRSCGKTSKQSPMQALFLQRNAEADS